MTEHTIHIWDDPYAEGFSICKSDHVVIKSGLTVLVGCNGIGKTTMLKNIEDQMKKENIPCYKFDNLQNGSSQSFGDAFYDNDLSFIADSLASSEGENITLSLGRQFAKLNEFMRTGTVNSTTSKLAKALSGSEHKILQTSERWMLFDAVDSGYSIDNIIDLKDFFEFLIKEFRDNGYDPYIVISANEYELADGSPCFDVANGEYVTFTTYQDFKKFILDSRDKKHSRFQ